MLSVASKYDCYSDNPENIRYFLCMFMQSETGHPVSSTVKTSSMIEHFKNIDSARKEQLLVQSAEKNDFTAVEFLILIGVSVDAKDYIRRLYYDSQNFKTPLMAAAERGHDDVLLLLIRSGANVNARDRFDITALHLATKHGHLSTVKILLESGAKSSPRSKSSRQFFRGMPHVSRTTPLHLAALKNHPNCIKELLNHGADFNAVDDRGESPLYIAAEYGHNECVLSLLGNAIGHKILSLPGFNTGDTPLHFAVKRGMIESVRQLLRLGSDVNHRNHSGSSPLHICVSNSLCDPSVSFEILKLLVLYGYKTDLNLPDSVELTPLHYVSFNAASVLTRRPEMARFLIAHGANINITNHQGMTLMQYEYNSTVSSDITVLDACIGTLTVLPRPSELKENNFAAVADHMPNNIVSFYSMWLGLRRGIHPVSFDAYDNFQQNVRMASNANVKSCEKQQWYKSFASNPLRLQHLCRCVIRKTIGYGNLRKVRYLPLPPLIHSYLVFGADLPTD